MYIPNRSSEDRALASGEVSGQFLMQTRTTMALTITPQ